MISLQFGGASIGSEHEPSRPPPQLHKLLIFRDNFTYLVKFDESVEPVPSWFVEQTTQLANFAWSAMNDLRAERLQVMLSPEELSAVDDFRFHRRMPTRAAAVRELLKLGLASVSVDAKAGVKSSDYGVFGRRARGSHAGRAEGPSRGLISTEARQANDPGTGVPGPSLEIASGPPGYEAASNPLTRPR
jgi:hypothetical protein